MIGMVLWILKIIGILVLAVLVFFLAAVLLVLFSAVCYQAKGSYQEKTLRGTGTVSWLFHIVTLNAVWEEEKKAVLRIFGIPVWSTEAHTEKTSVSEETSKEPFPNSEWETEEYPEPGGEPLQEEEGILSVQEVGSPQDWTDTFAEKKEPAASPVNRLFETVKKIWQKIRQTAAGVKQRFFAAMAYKEKVISWIENEENRQSVKLIIRQTGKIVRHILPGRGHGTITFGFGDDPYLTGKVLTGIAPFYPLYGEHIKVYPDFEHQVFDAEGCIKGRIRIGVVIGYAVRLLFDKNIRKNIRAFRAVG